MSEPINSYNAWWLRQNGKKVKIDGLSHRIQVQTYHAIYPYKHEVISVYAEPVNKRSAYYLRERKKLGDDWSTDVLGSPALERELRIQLRGKEE